MSNYHCYRTLLFICAALTSFSATSNTVSGKVVFEDSIATSTTERIVVRVTSLELPIEFDTVEQELFITDSDADSNQFEIEIGDPQGDFYISASCRSNLSVDYWCGNYENNGRKAVFPYQARIFGGIASDISDLSIIISDTVKVQGVVAYSGEEQTEPTSTIVVLNPSIDVRFPPRVDPETNQLTSSSVQFPQTNVRFEEGQFVSPYAVKIPVSAGIDYSLSLFCSGCVTGSLFSLDKEGRLFGSGTDHFLPEKIFNDTRTQSQALFLDAFTQPVNVSGQLSFKTANDSVEDIDAKLKVFASARPNKVIAEENFVIPASTQSVKFSFRDLVSDPSGSKLGFSIECSNCENDKPKFRPSVLLNARRNHANVTLSFNADKIERPLIAPVMLLLDD